MAQRFDYIHHRNHSFMLFRQLVTPANHFKGYKRANSVVHSYQTGSLHKRQPVLHRMKTGLAAICHKMFHRKMMFFAKLFPEVLLFTGKYQNNLKHRIVLAECFQRTHQHRFATDRKKLFGKIASHSQALSTGDNDYIFLHGRFSV